MKLLVLAQLPPPVHGQSLMVEHLLKALEEAEAAGEGVPFTHLNFRFSGGAEEIGRARPGKFFALVGHLLRALGRRLTGRADTLYYVPAPPRSVPILRDWLALGLLRLAYRRLVLHWHAVGLGEWTRRPGGGRGARLGRAITRRVLGRADLALVLSEFNRADAEVFAPRRVAVLPNGVADPFGAAAVAEVIALRMDRTDLCRATLAAAADGLPAPVAPGGDDPVYTLLFCSLCSREKGLVAAVEGAAAAAADLRGRGASVHLLLEVAGNFPNPEEEAAFRAACEKAGGQDGFEVRHLGFVSGAAKKDLFARADALLLPSRYPAEGLPLVLIEALAAGLPAVATRWRGIPEVFPADYPLLVETGGDEALAAAVAQRVAGLVDGTVGVDFWALRSHFKAAFDLPLFQRDAIRWLRSLDASEAGGSAPSRSGGRE